VVAAVVPLCGDPDEVITELGEVDQLPRGLNVLARASPARVAAVAAVAFSDVFMVWLLQNPAARLSRDADRKSVEGRVSST
jgi:hypothetical protein